jgi:hypothetical protein
MIIGQKYQSKSEAFHDCEIRKISLIENEYFVEVLDQDGYNTYTLDLFFEFFKAININNYGKEN